MKVCDSWLKDWTQPNLTSQEMVHKLTMAGLEVDEVSLAAPFFSNVVVAEVVSTARHPQADKLTVCQVNQGQEIVQVVCGAANVREGLKVALAKPGAKLPGGLNIAEAKLRGEVSLGMLCSPQELGCADSSEGIWELPKDAPIGQDLRRYLNLDEEIYALELTPNRGDCFSALGLARELAAITASEFKPQQIPAVAATHQETLNITVMDKWAPLYCGRIIKNIRPHTPSPLWLKEKLRRVGLRSLHPVVDVLNYVMYYLGQPMHAFDCHKIGSDLVVRDAVMGESMTLLNGKQVDLQLGTPVIANGEQVLAIAGVMGSVDSAVDEDSSIIFLESAFFNPVKLSGVARFYGLSTDASIRFERGVDPCLAPDALEFATQLILSIVGGEPGPLVMKQDLANLPQHSPIEFKPALFAKRTGVVLSDDEMKKILKALNCKVDAEKEVWQVTAPSYRFDLAVDVDLVEEILRIYGYENINSLAIEGCLQAGSIDKIENLQSQMVDVLCHLGYQEAINYAFVDPKIQNTLLPSEKGIRLLNPISPELAEMRLSLWPGLIASLVKNVSRQQHALQLCEVGSTFHGSSHEPREEARIAGLLYGAPSALNWKSSKKNQDFYSAKGQLEHLLRSVGYRDLRFISSPIEGLHPGQSAKIEVMGVDCGVIGCLHPQLQHAWDLPLPVVLWELRLNQLPQAPALSYKSLSKYPGTRRDMSFLIGKTVEAQAIIDAVRSAVSAEILQDVKIFDVYQGANIASDMVSVTLACLFQDRNKTLIEVDILSLQDAILKVLQQKFDIKLRDGQ